jgi:hypothetical protein
VTWAAFSLVVSLVLRVLMLLELCYFWLEFVQVNQLVHVFVIKSAKENGLKKKKTERLK